MGQASSRNRNVRLTSEVSPSIDPPPYEAIRHDVPRTVDAQSSDVLASNTPAQQSSIRRSLKTLLSPKSLKSLLRGGDRSTSQSSTSRSSRKRWPTSRRWSTVPEEFIAPSQDMVTESSSEGLNTPDNSSDAIHAEREDVGVDKGRRSSRKSWPTSRRWSTPPEELAARQQHTVASIPEDAPVASSSTNGVERENTGVDTGRRSSRKSWPTSRRWSTAPEELAAQSQERVTSIPEDAPVTSSSTHRESVHVDTGRRSSGKNWPTSRRWSTAPDELVMQPQETVTSDTAEGLDAPLNANRGEREHVGETITPVYRFTTGSPVCGPSIPIAETMTSNLSVSENEPETSSNIGSWMSGQGSLAQHLGLPNSEEDEVVISPSTFTEERDHHTGVEANVETTDRTHTSTQPAAQDRQAPIPAPLPLPLPPPASEPQPHRPFPPPGTLVVVQGVVHTTDVSPPQPPTPAAASLSPSSPMPMNSRRASSFIPQPSRGEASFPRSRRASVLPRTSGMRTRPSSMFESRSIMEGSSDSEPDTPSDVATTGSGSDTRVPVSSDHTTPVLSPSSIDVLGTLLSVAAAATAASLLTGSSDPIFTPSLNPPSAPNRPQSNSTSIFDRPTSPTPTAGLGNLGSLSAALGLGTPEATPQTYGGRERMRHVWGTLRDRLGRRMAGHGSGNSQPASNNEQHPNGQTRPNGAPIDTREIMLAEMARAFNLGLGLSNGPASPDASAGGERNNGQAESEHSPSATSSGSDGEPRPPEISLPAEGSFERFLMDLQVDLRSALSAQEPSVNRLPYTQHSDPEARLADSRPASPIPSSSSRPTTIVEHDVQPRVEGVIVGSLSPLPPSTTSASLTDQDDEQDLPPLLSVHQHDNREDDPELPGSGSLAPPPASFRPSGRSDSESDNANGDLHQMSGVPRVAAGVAADSSSSADSSPSGEGVTIEPGSSSRTERRPGGGINWWRSYRFPSITAPHTHGLPNGMNSASSPPTTPHSSDHPSEAPTTPSSSTPLSSPSSSTQDQSGASSPVVDNRSNVVVPVIVVGLQSVNMDRRPEQASPFGDSTFGGTQNEPEPSVLADDMNFGGVLDDADPGAFPGSPRARPWHSRAASALRNLRPGRRTTHATHMNGGPGSRTFLIYVIGGYYPPDHGLITGANALDSFEALWELAELLGQVKPQTVSKEEIDNSGLEVIRPAALEQYEKDGKVASNCMERCLICLDDYVPETDLRLLKCKHAFHKNCVDQWLQTGKNNCPACRTKGVSTPESTPA